MHANVFQLQKSGKSFFYNFKEILALSFVRKDDITDQNFYVGKFMNCPPSKVQYNFYFCWTCFLEIFLKVTLVAMNLIFFYLFFSETRCKEICQSNNISCNLEEKACMNMMQIWHPYFKFVEDVSVPGKIY